MRGQAANKASAKATNPKKKIISIIVSFPFVILRANPPHNLRGD
jgi:hypothetical protein